MATPGNVIGSASFQECVAITLDDDNDVTSPYDAFLVGGAGNLTIIDMNGHTVLLSGLLAGVVYQIRAKRFKSTGSTASATLKLVGLRY